MGGFNPGQPSGQQQAINMLGQGSRGADPRFGRFLDRFKTREPMGANRFPGGPETMMRPPAYGPARDVPINQRSDGKPPPAFAAEGHPGQGAWGRPGDAAMKAQMLMQLLRGLRR